MNLKRVWFVDIGQMPSNEVGDFMKKFRDNIMSGDGENAFVPIRPGSNTRVEELGVPQPAESDEQPVQLPPALGFAIYTKMNQKEADAFARDLKAKIEDGTYKLGNDLFIPLPEGIDIVVLR